MMRNITGALGVRCQFCHVGEEGMPLERFDFAEPWIRGTEGQIVPLAGVNLTGATDVRLESPLVSLRAARADVVREGRVVRIVVKG